MGRRSLPPAFWGGSHAYCRDHMPLSRDGTEIEVTGRVARPLMCHTCRRPLRCQLSIGGVNYVFSGMADLIGAGPSFWNSIWSFPAVPAEYRTEAVKGIAESALRQGDPGRLPILADALQDAGYESPMLPVLRGEVPGQASVSGVWSAVVGTGTSRSVSDFYAYKRHVEPMRDLAERVHRSRLTNDRRRLLETFLAVTAPGVDAPTVFRGIVDSDPVVRSSWGRHLLGRSGWGQK